MILFVFHGASMQWQKMQKSEWAGWNQDPILVMVGVIQSQWLPCISYFYLLCMYQSDWDKGMWKRQWLIPYQMIHSQGSLSIVMICNQLQNQQTRRMLIMHVVQYGKGVDYDSRLWRLSFVCVCTSSNPRLLFQHGICFNNQLFISDGTRTNQQSQISPHSAIKFPRDRVKDSTFWASKKPISLFIYTIG